MSAPIDMPPKTPADAGDEHTAENGISYTWDGAKWVTTLTAEERAERLWVRVASIPPSFLSTLAMM